LSRKSWIRFRIAAAESILTMSIARGRCDGVPSLSMGLVGKNLSVVVGFMMMILRRTVDVLLAVMSYSVHSRSHPENQKWSWMNRGSRRLPIEIDFRDVAVIGISWFDTGYSMLEKPSRLSRLFLYPHSQNGVGSIILVRSL
jgi:hypothetical protein